MARRVSRIVKKARRLEVDERWAEASDLYRAAIAKEPGDARLWYRLGWTLQRQRAWIGAADAYRRAIALGVDSSRIHFRLGRVAERAGNPGEAREAYRHSEQRRRPSPSVKGVSGRQLPYIHRLDLELMNKPSYAYILFRGARLAQQLGIERISALEFGVAGGNGLLAMEQHAADVEAMTGVGIDVVGFDTGEGLFAPKDHRDMPYVFAQGNYRIDVEALESRLQRARLVFGDAAETFPEYLASGAPPVGAVSFDMDLYSATTDVFASMRDGSDESRFLPRVPLYFDDVVGKGVQNYNDFTGELLAITDFNAANETTKVAEDRYFRTLPLNAAWHHCIYVMHRFKHPEYDTRLSKAGPGTLALRQS